MEQEVPQELVEAARGYDALFVPALFQPWTRHIIDAARIGEGARVLDIACGTGVLARDVLARTGPDGRVVGIDPAPGMIAAANELEPAIEWILCGAESLEIDDASVDNVVSQFGMMFFQDRQQAVAEMHRVLKPDGTVTIAIWNSVDHNPAYADVIEVLQQNVSTAAADALRLPYSLGNPDEVTSLLNASGFSNVEVNTIVETARFPSSRHMVEAELRGWLPLFDILLDEDKIRDVLVESDRLLAKYASDSGEAVFPTSAHVITACKI